MPQTRRKLGRKTRGPGIINQPDVDHVEKMNLILKSIGCEFHLNEWLEIDNMKRTRGVDFRQVWRRSNAIACDPFAGEDHMNRVASFCPWPIEKHVYTFYMPKDKAGGCERRLDAL